MRYCICVDIGATRLRVGIGREDGHILNVVECSTREVVLKYRDSTAIARGIEELVNKLMNRHNIERIEGIGIGSIGPLDIKRGIITKPPNLPISDQDYDIKKYLEDRYKVKVILLNDCVTAVWGEKWFGAGKNHNNIVYITFSTGIGGGIIVNNTLLLGADGNAHEIGHVVVDPSDDALRCGCGGLGHWEAYCSGIGIPRFAKKLAEREFSQEYSRSPIRNIDFDNYNEFTRKFFEYLRNGDKFCNMVFERISRLNAIGIATVIHYYNPEIIILGGSIAINNEDEIMKFRRYLDNYLMRGIRVPKFVVSPLGEYAILKGAIALIFHTPSTYLRYF